MPAGNKKSARTATVVRTRGGEAGGKAPRLDATNLAGLTTLMNPQHIKTGTNLDEAEKTIMGKQTVAAASADPEKLYAAELSQLMAELGIDKFDDTPAEVPRAVAAAPRVASPTLATLPPSRSVTDKLVPGPGNYRDKVTSLIDDIDLGPAPRRAGSSRSSSSSGTASRSSAATSGTDSAASTSGDDERVDQILTNLDRDLGIKPDSRRERRRRQVRDDFRPRLGRREGREGRQGDSDGDGIDDVLEGLHGETRTPAGAERERLQDSKTTKLEQIAQLRMALEEESIDCKSVSIPTAKSSMAEIDSVLNILRLKNDRNRYSSLAEEVILGLAEGIEAVFDGTRALPLLGYQPDYTGYHNTVLVKLHRMRLETSQVVGDIVSRYNIGSPMRILMELAPSFFIYPRQQRKQRNTPGLSTDPAGGGFGASFSAIRESDERRELAVASSL